MFELILRIRAPFAAFRGYQAGTYRATSPVMPPSAAYGLVLNLAGFEMRDSKNGVSTLVREVLPRCNIAVGLVTFPQVVSLYQQLHAYPVGASSKELAKGAKGAKYHIAPVRREFLVDYEGTVAVQSEDGALMGSLARALRGTPQHPRYGLPSAGDNSCLIDEIVSESGVSAHWYRQIVSETGPVKGSCRLTISIDRNDNSRTEIGLFAPMEPKERPGPDCWVQPYRGSASNVEK